MGIVEALSKHWDVAAVVGCAVWVGRISQRVSDLRKRVLAVEQADGGMDSSRCLQHREACRSELLGDLQAGQVVFGEIKQQIAKVDEKAEKRHDMVMNHLLGIKEGGD